MVHFLVCVDVSNVYKSTVVGFTLTKQIFIVRRMQPQPDAPMCHGTHEKCIQKLYTQSFDRFIRLQQTEQQIRYYFEQIRSNVELTFCHNSAKRISHNRKSHRWTNGCIYSFRTKLSHELWRSDFVPEIQPEIQFVSITLIVIIYESICVGRKSTNHYMPQRVIISQLTWINKLRSKCKFCTRCP